MKYLGMHVVGNSPAAGWAKQQAERGTPFRAVTVVDNFTLAGEIKAVSPATIIVVRIRNWADGLDEENWGTGRRIEECDGSHAALEAIATELVNRALAGKVFAELKQADYLQLINECSVKGRENYRRLGLVSMLCADKARAALGMRFCHLNSSWGCNEWDELLGLKDARFFDYIRSYGDVLGVHEAVGPFSDTPISAGYGGPIPGSPVDAEGKSLIANAGPYAFRCRFADAVAGFTVQKIVTEFYAGGGYPTDDGERMEDVLARFQWYDAHCTPEFLGVCGFNVGALWGHQNYIPVYEKLMPLMQPLVPVPQPAPHGIDVSSIQSTVDWQAVRAAGVDFAFIRASSGGRIDTRFRENWTRARAAGVLRGAYHWLDPRGDGQQQAALFLGALTSDAGELPPVLDIEVPSGISYTPEFYATEAKRWLDTVAGHLRVRPLIYTARWFWDDPRKPTGPHAPWAKDYPLWVADYTGPVQLPSAWQRWTFHQYTNTGAVEGVIGQVDRNVFNGTLAELRALAAIQPLTNQDVFRLVRAVNPQAVGLSIPYDLMTAMLADRQAPYTGPDPRTWGLSDEQKIELARRMERHGGTVVPGGTAVPSSAGMSADMTGALDDSHS